jgi:hypothetical protein
VIVVVTPQGKPAVRIKAEESFNCLQIFYREMVQLAAKLVEQNCGRDPAVDKQHAGKDGYIPQSEPGAHVPDAD